VLFFICEKAKLGLSFVVNKKKLAVLAARFEFATLMKRITAGIPSLIMKAQTCFGL